MDKIEIQKHIRSLKLAKDLVENAYQAMKNDKVFREFGSSSDGELMMQAEFHLAKESINEMILAAEAALREAK